jgi:ribosomal protein S18 acetylase RimI-like enzyme
MGISEGYMDDSIFLKDYTDGDAPAVARMWEESREGWPAGFFGASSVTAESVASEERSSGGLFTALAWHGERVVGFCRTTPYGGERDATYVALLSVVPDMHGRKIGKELLLDAVNRVSSRGYYRIDLHTWPANMKAVPLYKKTGFFWVPDSTVYMQNYMPFLLRRPEFREFMGGDYWYDCFDRDLSVAHDEEKTPSGRDVFTYVFRRGGEEFRAVFDRTGRILSKMEAPGFSASIERSGGKVFFGVPVTVSLEGSSLPGRLDIASDDTLEAPASFDTGSGGFGVSADPVRVPATRRDRAPRVSVTLPAAEPLELGLGFRAEEPVSVVSPPVRFPGPGQVSLELDLKRLADADEVTLRYSVDGGEERRADVALSGAVYQTCSLDLPALDSGMHVLEVVPVCDGVAGYPESAALVAGPYTGTPTVVDTRYAALVVSDGLVLSVARKGASSEVLGRSMDDRPERLAGLGVLAGPPLWHGDLPLQVYDLESGEGAVSASTDWPSRKGLEHSCTFGIDRSGVIEVRSAVHNGSDTEQKVIFRIVWGGGSVFDPRTDLIPLEGCLHAERRVFNQVPDWSEDMPRKTEELGAPWTGLLGPDRAVMAYFEGWPAIQYDCPETGDLIVPPGETAETPVFRMLFTEGGLKPLLRRARSLGWDLGETGRRLRFPDHNLEPVVGSGFGVTLTHGLRGEREGTILLGTERIAGGRIRSGEAVSGELRGSGPSEVVFDVAGRSFSVPAFLVEEGEGVSTGEEDDGSLSIVNDPIRALVDPSKCGHVWSLELDGVQYLRASHPEPGELGWEKPWFGGIHPRIADSHETPFRLEEHMPVVRLFERQSGGLCERGWEQVWEVDHWRFGSFRLSWQVTVLPGVPVLRTRLDADPLAGSAIGGEMDVRGFLQPGGEYSGGVLTCESDPSLRQGRKHSGAWGTMGRWARVESPGKGFVEGYSLSDGVLFCEDYSGEGCHLAVFCPLTGRRTVEMLWLFGPGAGGGLSDILRFHV